MERDILPYESTLPVRELFIPMDETEQLRKKAESLPALSMTKLDLQWLQVLAEGWATPLRGFMRENQYLRCQHHGVLFNGNGTSTAINQSVPIVLTASDEDKARLA